MALFRSLRRPLGGFMPAEPEQIVVRDEGVTEDLHHLEILGRLILRQIGKLERQMAEQNITTDQILAVVKEQQGKIASMSALMGSIKERLNVALEGQISPAGKATLNDILSELQGNSRVINDAIATNDDDPTTVASDGSGGPVTPPPSTERAATSTVLSTSKAVIQVGESVTFSAAVSAAAGIDKPVTGSVTFLSGDQEIGGASITDGVASFSTADAPAGDHSITAVYGGDANFAASTSAAITQSVLPVEPPAPTPPTETPAPTPPVAETPAA